MKTIKIPLNIIKTDKFKERFFGRVQKTTTCWIWKTENKDIKEYGKIKINNIQYRAHRLSYVLMGQKDPKNKILDHICNNRICVNPKHLRTLTNKENILRGNGPAEMNARKKICSRGHDYDIENTYFLNGKRYCRQCNKIRMKIYKQKQKSAVFL